MEIGARGGPFYFLPKLASKDSVRLKVVKFLPAIIWFIISLVLFTISPPKLPDEEIFKIPHQDKIIHSIIFFLLVYLFCRPFKVIEMPKAKVASWFLSIALYGLVYGISVEFIQKYFVSNRSYEIWDIVADAIGCLIGYLYCSKYFIK